MPRKKKLHPADQAARETEALNSVIRTDGQGEHPAIQTLMSPDFAQMSNLDASQIALMLQEIIRGQNSLLQQNSAQIAQIRERQDHIDREFAERFESQQKFIQEVLDKAESLKRTGLENDKLIAQGIAQYQQAKESAVANLAVKNLALEQALASQPKVTVVSSGELITTMEHGQQVSKIIPEEIRIRNKRWVLPIGRAIDVPQVVADIMIQRKASRVETSKRQELLSKHLETKILAEEWNKIEGSKTENMPIG